MNDSGGRPSRLCGYSQRRENGADEWCCPGGDQSGEEIAAWLREHGSPGEVVVVFFKQQALCQFRLDEIAARQGRRFHLAEHGAFDEQGFAVSRPKNVSLRILKPSVPALEAAVRGATLQHCQLVNERELSASERALAARIHRAMPRQP